MNKTVRVIFVALLGINSVTLSALSIANKADSSATVIKIDPTIEYQTMQGFGASDAWSVNEVGATWPEETREQAAKWLFSKSTDLQGNPIGIGLSMWRFNIGAGSTRQGNKSGINNPLRRTEGFLQPDGQYDWSKQHGQQWFLFQAKQYGVEKFVAFSNSPPVQYTRNGIGHGSGDFNANLKPNHYDDFARFLAKVLSHFNDQGLAFDYVSPLNEPQYKWEGPKQEGSPWTNTEIAKVVRKLDRELSKNDLTTQIMVSEAAEYRYLTGNKKKRDNPLHHNQIEDFFASSSENFIGDLKHIPKMIAGHSYWTIYNNEQIRKERKALKQKAKEYGLKFYQSEYCLLGLENITDHRPSLDEWDIALFMTKIIHADLTLADAASWSYWTSLSRTNERAKNRYLLIEKQDNGLHDKTVRASKSLWALGHYSYFIRPGFIRVENSRSNSLEGILSSSYISPDKKILVTVLINMDNRERSVEFRFNTNVNSKNQTDYITSSDQNFEKIETKPKIILPPKSILTRVSQISF